MSGMKDLLGDTPFPAPRTVAYQPTSRAAYEQFAPVSGELDRCILAVIREAGQAGIICQAIEAAIGRSHQAVSGNLRHLVEKGLVEPSGNFGLTTSKRRAIKWRIK